MGVGQLSREDLITRCKKQEAEIKGLRAQVHYQQPALPCDSCSRLL